jgi:hypothetical protein
MGVDLSPGLFGLELPELPVIAEEFPDKKMLISGPLKLIWYGPGCRKQGTWLFNLADDPREENNLADARPEAANAMKGELERILRDYEERGFRRHTMVQEKLAAADLEALAQLGYIGDGAEEDAESGDGDGAADRGASEAPPEGDTEPSAGDRKGRGRRRKVDGGAAEPKGGSPARPVDGAKGGADDGAGAGGP